MSEDIGRGGVESSVLLLAETVTKGERRMDMLGGWYFLYKFKCSIHPVKRPMATQRRSDATSYLH